MRNRLLCVLFFPTLLFAQQLQTIEQLQKELLLVKPDTAKVNRLNELASAYTIIDSTKSLFYSRNALVLANSLAWNEGIAKSNYYIGNNYAKNFKFSKALFYFEKALASTKNKQIHSTVLSAIAQVYLQQSNFTKALEFFHRSLRLHEELHNKNGIVTVSIYIGSVYAGLNDQKKALAIYNKSLEINKELDNDLHFATIFRGIAIVHYSLGDYEKSLQLFEKSLAIVKKIKNHGLEAKLLSDISLVHLDAGNYSKAISYSKLALTKNNNGVKDQLNIAFIYGIIGDSYMEMAKENKNNRALLNNATFYLNKAIVIHKQLGSLRSLLDDYFSLTEVQKMQRNFEAALQSHQI